MLKISDFYLDKQTSPKGFSASKCNVGIWIFSKSQKFFGFFGKIFWEDFLGGFLGGFFWRNSLCYFNVEGIDLFVKILVFVKILSKSQKEGRILDPQKCDCKYIALKNNVGLLNEVYKSCQNISTTAVGFTKSRAFVSMRLKLHYSTLS